jgi:hypothetical protein
MIPTIELVNTLFTLFTLFITAYQLIDHELLPTLLLRSSNYMTMKFMTNSELIRGAKGPEVCQFV